MLQKLKKFLKLRFTDKLIIFESILILFIVRFFVKFFGFRFSHSVLKNFPLFPFKLKDENKIIEKICILTKTSSKVIPINTSCLEESISIWLILKTRGIESYLKIGIKKEETELNAHAWVEINGRIINESGSSFSDFDHRFFYKNKQNL